MNKETAIKAMQNSTLDTSAEDWIIARLAASERLKVAASKAADVLYELGHDAYNDLAMALVDFERANGEIE